MGAAGRRYHTVPRSKRTDLPDLPSRPGSGVRSSRRVPGTRELKLSSRNCIRPEAHRRKRAPVRVLQPYPATPRAKNERVKRDCRFVLRGISNDAALQSRAGRDRPRAPSRERRRTEKCWLKSEFTLANLKYSIHLRFTFLVGFFKSAL